MSENITQEQAARPFEERMMTILLELREQVGQLNERVAKLEAKQYDTMPIWEQALNEIVELRHEMREYRRDTERGFRNSERELDVFIQDFIDMRDKRTI